MLIVNDTLSIPLSEFQFEFSRSGGPGGQNVNKVNSRATLRWKPGESPSLPEPVRQRLLGTDRLEADERGRAAHQLAAHPRPRTQRRGLPGEAPPPAPGGRQAADAPATNKTDESLATTSAGGQGPPVANQATPPSARHGRLNAMADYSPHQRKIIDRYYKNYDAIKYQRLAELVTELYLAEGKKRDRYWTQVLDHPPRPGVARKPRCPHRPEAGPSLAGGRPEGAGAEGLMAPGRRRDALGTAIGGAGDGGGTRFVGPGGES